MKHNPLWAAFWQQIRKHNAHQQARHKKRQFQPGGTDPFIEQRAGKDAKVDGEQCWEKTVDVNGICTGTLLIRGMRSIGSLLRRCIPLRTGNVKATQQELGDRTATGTGQHQPEGGCCDADLHRIFDLKLFSKRGSPGDGGAVATNQWDGSHQQSRGGMEPQQTCHRNTKQVLQCHESNGQPKQDEKSRATATEITEASTHPHRGEEIDQQEISWLETKKQLRATNNMQNCEQQGH